MNNDFEKSRAEHVTRLELILANTQRELAELKADEKWVPKFGSELTPEGDKARLTLSFAGKNQTAVFPKEFLLQTELTDAVTAVIEQGFSEMILERFRGMVEPEIAKLQQGVRAIQGAGKW